MYRITMVSIALALFAKPDAALAAQPPSVEFIDSPQAAAAGRPFSQAVRVGELMFLSGEIGVDNATGELVEGGIRAEAKQAMQNIGAVLAGQGLSMDDLVKCTVMLADIAEWGVFNEVYRGFFPSGRYPARSALGANGLAMSARVEVECIAAVPAEQDG